MLKDSNTVIPYDNIDYEIRDLIRYINSIDGIETVESCCGHGKRPCSIWFKADDIGSVTRFIYRYLYRNNNWRIKIVMSDNDIDEKQWENPSYLLETTFPNHYYVGLAIDNLTYILKERLIKNDNSR